MSSIATCTRLTGRSGSISWACAAILSNAQGGLRFLHGGNPELGEIRAILADIVHDDKRAGTIISGLRTMLRRKETPRERINLAHTIEEVLALVHSELVSRHVDLRLRLEPDALVLANKGQVQQVMLNRQELERIQACLLSLTPREGEVLEYVIKPVDDRALLDAIRWVLSDFYPKPTADTE